MDPAVTVRRSFGQRLRDWCLRHFAGVVTLVSFLVYAATGAYSAQSIDVVAAEEPAWALATRGTLNLLGVAHHDLPWYFEHKGGVYSDRFPGAILFLVPGYWLAGLLGVDAFSLGPGVVTAAAVAGATVGVVYRVFSVVLSVPQARVAALFVAFGTGTWSISGDAPWSHTVGQFCVAVTLLALSRKRDHLAALTAGLLALTRPVQVVASVVLGVSLAWQRRSVTTAVWFGLLTIPGVLLLFAYNGLLFGNWGPSNGQELGGDISLRPMDLPVNILGTVFSPTRGLVFFYPFLVLVPLGFQTAWRDCADWERSALLAGAGGLLVQLALNRYSGGDTFFGNRLVIEGMTFAAPILARSSVIVAEGPYRRLMFLSLTFGVAIHAIGAAIPA